MTASQYTPLSPSLAIQGVIISGNHNVFTVECNDGKIRQCAIKGKVLGDKALHNALASGDVVTVEDVPTEEAILRGMIVSVLPRKNGFFRWNDKSLKRQLLAANIDVVLLVTTPAEPPFRPRFIDRALVQCGADSLVPWIVCNKCDVAAAQDAAFVGRVDAWRAAGIRVFTVSAATMDGMAELLTAIEHIETQCGTTGMVSTPAPPLPITAVLVGQSGVGKSSLVNAFAHNTIRRTGALCAKYDRGAHTTAMGCMVRAMGASGEVRLIDTPGVRRFALHGVEMADVPLHFAEMARFVGKCRYGMSCTHTVEAGCAIRSAVSAGEITAERYDSYLRIRAGKD